VSHFTEPPTDKVDPMNCKFCGASLPESSTFCAYCGKHQASGGRVGEKQGVVHNFSVGFYAALMAIFFMTVFVIYSMVVSDNNRPTSQGSSQGTPLWMPGDEAHLSPGSPTIVPLDEEAEDEVVKLAAAKDDLGLRQMVISGRAILVPDGTKVKVIEVKGILDWTCRIRILEGDYIGQSGWVPVEFLKRSASPLPPSTATSNQPEQKPPATGSQTSHARAGPRLAVGDKAIIYSSWLMATDEQANTQLGNMDNASALKTYEELALEGRVLNCSPNDRPSIQRTSVVILDTRTSLGGKLYPKVRITGILRGSPDEPVRSAGFADEDRTGSPDDCFFLQGQPPNVSYRWVNSIGSVGYIDEDRLYPVDAAGHDLRFRESK